MNNTPETVEAMLKKHMCLMCDKVPTLGATCPKCSDLLHERKLKRERNEVWPKKRIVRYKDGEEWKTKEVSYCPHDDIDKYARDCRKCGEQIANPPETVEAKAKKLLKDYKSTRGMPFEAVTGSVLKDEIVNLFPEMAEELERLHKKVEVAKNAMEEWIEFHSQTGVGDCECPQCKIISTALSKINSL